jgi:DNA/RNA-binding domain of Phe-tRNA-synthetase-like protein
MTLTTPSGRAVLADDGERIVLTNYRGSARTAVELSPRLALALAQELLAAALLRLPPP